MMLNVQSWDDIAGGHADDEAADIVLSRLEDAPWLSSVGASSNRDHEVTRVHTWAESLRMFRESSSTEARVTGISGVLNAPFWLLLRRLDNDESLHRRTANVANSALDRLVTLRTSIGGAVRRACNAGELTADRFETKLAIGDYVDRSIRLLFIELYAGDIMEPRCTYFRDQLGWFLAGLLPCGWDGEWPEGRMRVL